MNLSSIHLLIERNRRSRTDILATIIKATKKGETQFKIREEARLNHQQLKLYLAELTTFGLVEMNELNGKRVYVASEKGIEYLRQYEVLSRFLR
jgi:predicted transcriptional regulator